MDKCLLSRHKVCMAQMMYREIEWIQNSSISSIVWKIISHDYDIHGFQYSHLYYLWLFMILIPFLWLDDFVNVAKLNLLNSQQDTWGNLLHFDPLIPFHNYPRIPCLMHRYSLSKLRIFSHNFWSSIISPDLCVDTLETNGCWFSNIFILILWTENV